MNGYFQDTWKIRPKLTLNLGIRYEFSQPPTDKWGHASLYDLPANTNIFGAWKSNYKNLQPARGPGVRRITNSTVIRTGFGILGHIPIRTSF